PQDNYPFFQVTAIVVGAWLIIAFFIAPFIGIQEAILIFMGMAVTGVAMAFLLSRLIKGIGNLAAGLFLGSIKLDDPTTLKRMYRQANGYKLAFKFAMAEKSYWQIIDEYPQETEAQFLLAQLLWKELERPGEALKMLKKLEQKIQREDLEFQYRSTLKRYLTEWSEEAAQRSG
ncbi:hypothetical protein GWN42_31840, partial [candidate division KSB1 bacterium]|nr:hypothetical protein [candidate division KSB1 bacterium]NIS24658.1 hypothetical protein [candidate division KSB1 bacterium]NIU25258.1 hypothetical protein [candidate division KSB1 bacterium]NIU91945.1 hypothetical protein [candidate division KSB1 bacterium]NIV97262.1 hypothetical protein [candidate division KSB1 bacterium]